MVDFSLLPPGAPISSEDASAPRGLPSPLGWLSHRAARERAVLGWCLSQGVKSQEQSLCLRCLCVCGTQGCRSSLLPTGKDTGFRWHQVSPSEPHSHGPALGHASYWQSCLTLLYTFSGFTLGSDVHTPPLALHPSYGPAAPRLFQGWEGTA